ncbi:hypothetical protein ACFYZ6_34365 [Streptomyces rubiginosohelvolus]|uniref:hypothetical protein n=1 Tax=Streptomyces rubiginosohelvolus TaxID=67362 RepID=UPI0036C38F9D
MRISLLVPSAAPAARRAAEAGYVMLEAITAGELEAARAVAVGAEAERVDDVRGTLAG